MSYHFLCHVMDGVRLRTLSDSGNSSHTSATPVTPPVSSSSMMPPQYKLAEHRYGREEMLALYTSSSSIVPDISDTSIMTSKPFGPLCLEPMSEEEQVYFSFNIHPKGTV